MITIPFYGGGQALFDGEYTDPRNLPFTVYLDGEWYPVDLTEYRHNGVARFRQGVSTSGEINDQLLNSEPAWWRYRFSWHSGAGQEIDELDPDSIASRYQASRGINPWDKYQACLLNDTESVLAVSAAYPYMCSTGSYVYVSDGSTVKRSGDLISWSTITGISGTVQGLCSDGTNCYIATTVNMYTVSSTVAASLTTSATPQSYDHCAFVSNKLIAASDNDIGEITSSTFDVFYTHFQPAFIWTAIFNVGSRIYVGGYSGNRSELYTLTTDENGALIRSNEAASFFAGELLQAALSYGGSVILGTSAGIRFAQLGADATLTYGPLISEFGGCQAISAEGRFAYCGVSEFPGAGTGLVRLALDEFTADLLPAYATDIFTELDSSAVIATARFADRTVFSVSGDAVYATDEDLFLTTGYIDSGDITFGTVEDKSLSSLRVKYDALDTNEAVTALLTNRAGATIGTKSDSIDGSDEMTLDVTGNSVDRARVRITLTGDGATTPCLTEWRMRGYPVAPGVEEWLVPLIIRSQVTVNESEGQVLSLDPWTAVASIVDIWQTQEIVLYKEGDHAFRVRIDNFQINAVDWRDGSDWFEVTCTVRLLST